LRIGNQTVLRGGTPGGCNPYYIWVARCPPFWVAPVARGYTGRLHVSHTFIPLKSTPFEQHLLSRYRGKSPSIWYRKALLNRLRSGIAFQRTLLITNPTTTTPAEASAQIIQIVSANRQVVCSTSPPRLMRRRVDAADVICMPGTPPAGHLADGVAHDMGAIR
jgi:hypothetical protein